MGGRLKRLLREQHLVKVCMLGQLAYPKIIEMIGYHGGWHAVWLDQEHAGLTSAQLEDASRAARAAGLDSFVRLNATDYATVMRALEAGADGIMASMVRSAAEAERIVRWAKFHPRGLRGVNGSGVDGHYGAYPPVDYFQRANAETFVAIQIECVEAVEEVEGIAALEDVDLLFVGPADLSQSMGLPGQWEHPRMWEALTRVAKAAAQHHKAWGILPRDAAHARRCAEMGCTVLSLGIDVWFVYGGLRAFQHGYAEFFSDGQAKGDAR